MFYEDFMTTTNPAGQQTMLLDLSSMFSHSTDDLVCESIPSSQSSSSSSSAVGSPPNFNLLPRFNLPPIPSGNLKPGSMSVLPSSSVHRSEHLMSMSSSSTSIDVNNSIICTKQTEIRQKLQVLEAKIQLAQKSFHFKEEERLALLMEKSKLERELRRLIMNQKRQKRFRDRKRLRKKETLLRETSGGEQHAFETTTFDSSSVDNSSPFAVQPDASGTKIPFTDSASKMPNLSFTQENWESLEQQFPLLLSCPFVGGEDSNPTQDKAYQQHRLGEIAFLNRIEQIAQGADPTVAVKDILTILQVRKIFVQDCIRFRGNIPARTLLYLSMVGQSPISEEEKHKLSALASGR